MEQFYQKLADRRGFFGWFEHHAIASQQRRDNMAIGQMRGEIIGAKHRQHAVRFVPHRIAQAHRPLKPPLRRALAIGLNRNIHFVGD